MLCPHPWRTYRAGPRLLFDSDAMLRLVKRWAALGAALVLAMR
jgi:hypothetical protein